MVENSGAGLTQTEIRILTLVKTVLPKPFLQFDAFGDLNQWEQDQRMLGYAFLVINDLNWEHPVTNWDVKNFPSSLDGTLAIGLSAMTNLFMQMKWTMNDFSYTDNGLSLTLDRVTKLGAAYDNMWKIYSVQKTQIKNFVLLNNAVSLGTPRFQNQLGQFVRAAFGYAF